MSDYISKENTLKNIGLLNASVLMGNNKEVDNVIGGYNPTSFLVGMSYGLEQAQAMISSQPTVDEKEIIRKPFERVVERLEEKSFDMSFENPDCKAVWLDRAKEIVKEECGISE